MPEHVINDGNFKDRDHIGNGLCGCLPSRETLGEGICSAASSDLIPMEEWPARIKELETHQMSLWHIWRDSPIGVLSQNPLLYCWTFCSVEALMLERELQKLPYRPLSPSSVGAPIVNFQNIGYYIENALSGMVNQGAATTEYVPVTTNDRSKFRLGWKESAAGNKVLKWRSIAQRDFQAQGSMLLSNRPLATSLNWWEHAVLFLQLLDRYPNLRPTDPNRYGVKYLNSWGKEFGDGGCGILEGSRKIADSAYAIQQASFAE